MTFSPSSGAKNSGANLRSGLQPHNNIIMYYYNITCMTTFIEMSCSFAFCDNAHNCMTIILNFRDTVHKHSYVQYRKYVHVGDSLL